MNIDREGQQEKQLLRNVISHERSQSFMINGLKKKHEHRKAHSVSNYLQKKLTNPVVVNAQESIQNVFFSSRLTINFQRFKALTSLNYLDLKIFSGE